MAAGEREKRVTNVAEMARAEKKEKRSRQYVRPGAKMEKRDQSS